MIVLHRLKPDLGTAPATSGEMFLYGSNTGLTTKGERVRKTQGGEPVKVAEAGVGTGGAQMLKKLDEAKVGLGPCLIS